MAIFIRSLHETDKENVLQRAANNIRNGTDDSCVFTSDPDSFSLIKNSPFAYWVSRDVLDLFSGSNITASESYVSLYGLISSDNFRFLRLNWELPESRDTWRPLSKGGEFSKYYGDLHLSVNINGNFSEIVALANAKYPYLKGKARQMIHADVGNYFQPGITWTKATTAPLSFRALPANSVAGNGGSAFSAPDEQKQDLLVSMAILNSRPFSLLSSLSLGLAAEGRKNYEIGIIEKTPLPILEENSKQVLASFAQRAWQLKRTLDTAEETSHAFILPASLLDSAVYSPIKIEAELEDIQRRVDAICFDLYGFSESDRIDAQSSQGAVIEDQAESCADEEGDEDDRAGPIEQTVGLLSWAAGVAFGRFDWRLATGERAAPTEPEPFDPLPAKNPGMLPDGAAPFHAHTGILVDDPGYPHDIARLVEEVLARVGAPVPEGVRRWLQREFFTFHLQRYSKSRRKAPIYWPLSTTSGSYTLWVYYPSLTSQTLYTAINDFVEPKIKQVGADVTTLRNKGSARTRDDEKQFETLQGFELELIELRDALLNLAPNYKPNHDDGVQITAAPLWPLFRHKPWQKVLKDTWAKLEKGDYDWAQLAMNYWPDRVREKCKTDKSLAIAHGLEHLYVEPEVQPKKTRGRKKAGGDE